MPFVAAEINLTDKVTDILNKFAHSRTLPAWQIQRANIVVLASMGKNNREISEKVLLSRDKVSKWRTRWLKCEELINGTEQNSPDKLEETIESCLKDLPRPGCPCEFTEEQIIKILEIACRNPDEFGYETSHWSLNQLANTVTELGIVESISPSSISRFLKYG